MKRIKIVDYSRSMLILATMLVVISCKKDQQSLNKLPKSNQQVTSTISADRLLKIKKFISVISHVPVDKIFFDAASKKYTFGNDHVEAELIESLYDKSNVYQAEYEGGDK